MCVRQTTCVGWCLTSSIALVLAAAMPASATTLFGSWCADGMRLHIDAYGIGANEHTVCDSSPLPPGEEAFLEASLKCRNVYFEDRKADGTFEVVEIPMEAPRRVVAFLVPEDRLAVLFDENEIGLFLDRCDL